MRANIFSGGRGALLLACFFWAISFLASKVALRSTPPMTVVFLRLAVASLPFALLLLLRRENPLDSVRRIGAGRLLLLALCGTTLHFGTQTAGLQYTRAMKASLFVATGPLFILALSCLALGERLTPRKGAGVALALAGTLALLDPGALLSLSFRGELAGDLLVLASILLWGVFTVLGKRLNAGIDAATLTALCTFAGASTALPASLAFAGAGGLALGAIPPEAWAAILFLGLTCSFLASWLYFRALERLPASTVGLYLYTIPPQTALFSILFLGEPLTAQVVAGALLVLAGVRLTESADPSHGGAEGETRPADAAA